MKTHIIAIAKNQKMLFWMLTGMLLILAVMYVYLINLTVVNVVKRETLAREMNQTTSTVGELETSYMNLKSKITLDYAYAEGFHDATVSQFISRGQTVALSFNSAH